VSPIHTLCAPNIGSVVAVKLGFKKELAVVQDATERKMLYEKLLAQQYQKGQAQEVASVLEIDAVIEPANTRQTLLLELKIIK
jgi:acetyl-CoA carboxylase carboxyltransferase component